MAFYSYLSTKIIIAFITKSYQDLFGVRSYINAEVIPITDPVVGFVIVNDVIYPASKIYRSRECAMYDLKRKINKK